MLPSASGPDEQNFFFYPFDLVYFQPHSMSLNDLFFVVAFWGGVMGGAEGGGGGFGAYYGGSLVALP